MTRGWERIVRTQHPSARCGCLYPDLLLQNTEKRKAASSDLIRTDYNQECGDVNGDGKAGMEEVLYVLKRIGEE